MQKLIQSKVLRFTLGILLIILALIGGCFGIIFRDFGVMLMAVIIVWGGGSLVFRKPYQ